MLKEHTLAPLFCLPGSDGKEHCLAHYRTQWVVLYFYPRDNTPGCTQEACDFRDTFDSFTKHNCTVLGISKDSLKSHQGFQQKLNLNFVLLSDPDQSVHQSYEALEDTKTIRCTFLINPEGLIVKVWPKVSVKDHVLQVLEDLRQKQ